MQMLEEHAGLSGRREQESTFVVQGVRIQQERQRVDF